MPKLRLDLPVLLPTIFGDRDACVRRLIASVEAQAGVAEAHVKAGSPALLCIHYDSEVLTLPRLQTLVKIAGAEITERYQHIVLEVTGIRHQRHARQAGERIANTPGILEAVVSGAGVVRIEYDSQAIEQVEVQRAIEGTDLRLKKAASAKTQGGSAGDGRVLAKAVPKPERDMSGRPDQDDPAGHDHVAAKLESEAAYNADQKTEPSTKPHNHEHGGIFGANTELFFSIASGVFWLSGLIVSWQALGPSWLAIALYSVAILLGGYFILIEAFETLRQGKFEIDFLMLVAAAGAMVLGRWQEAALLLFLFSLGHALEAYAMNRARKSIEALSELAPPTALVKRDGTTVEIPAEQLQLGDVIVVKPNSKIAADGVVVAGTSAVDQAPITGESIAVDKRPIDDLNAQVELAQVAEASRAFAGTINGSSPLEIRVLKLAADSTLARMVTLVKEAETQTSPTQQFTDKFERIFVPAVLIFVVLLLFAFLVLDESFGESFYRAMAVLVAASPCALAISTPSAVLAGVARAARQGVLIKGGRPLEDLGGLTAIAFDKTGTLTEGKPKLTTVAPVEGVSETELLSVAVAVEQLSDHPLAAAIVEDGQARLGAEVKLQTAEQLEALTARGIRATLGGQAVHIGNRLLFEELTGQPVPAALDQQMSQLETEGQTAMIVRRGDQFLGIIAVMDVARAEAVSTLAALKELGIERMIMLTGDNQRVAEAVAKTLGITDPRGSLLPEDKVAAIEELRTTGGGVAMIGDGVNDAPAMARATVGIAMGAAGSDVALETADIALMADRLDNLPFAIGLSRKAKGIIRQNLWISLGMVAILIPLTLLGIAELGPAVIAHEGSTLLVVANALRLLGYKAK